MQRWDKPRVKVSTISTSHDDSQIRFTERQYEYLNSKYPERILPPTATDAEIRFYMGQRSMVVFVKSKVQKG